MTHIQVGDVCLDLCQGRPVHVVEDTNQTAAEWSGDHGYDLEENYGNSRLGTGPNDRVFDVVYCSSIKSEPSKTYAFPESRLARVETEAGDGGRPVADRVRVELLDELFQIAMILDEGWSVEPESWEDALTKLVTNGTNYGGTRLEEARELAKASRISADDEGAEDG